MTDPAPPLILASASPIRARLLSAAGLRFTVAEARIDEPSLRDALVAEHAAPRDVADALAEAKARKVSARRPEAAVIGCDQVLDLDGEILAKAETLEVAEAQLRALRGRVHLLHSAVVLYHGGQPAWRFVGKARLTMRPLSDAFVGGYLSRNWPAVQSSVGCYRIEEEGVRLFTAIEGDHFTILGLPLLPLFGYLADRGWIDA